MSDAFTNLVLSRFKCGSLTDEEWTRFECDIREGSTPADGFKCPGEFECPEEYVCDEEHIHNCEGDFTCAEPPIAQFTEPV